MTHIIHESIQGNNGFSFTVTRDDGDVIHVFWRKEEVLTYSPGGDFELQGELRTSSDPLFAVSAAIAVTQYRDSLTTSQGGQ